MYIPERHRIRDKVERPGAAGVVAHGWFLSALQNLQQCEVRIFWLMIWKTCSHLGCFFFFFDVHRYFSDGFYFFVTSSEFETNFRH